MKLASIEVIEALSNIDGADNIELARVQGWDVVVKKLELNVGDLCVYIPIDTLVDTTRSHFSFLKDSRIRTKKIRGVYSQGLVLPLSHFDENFSTFEVGIDVAELIGVTKYEKEECFSKGFTPSQKVSNFPGFPIHLISKTDEDNLRSKNKVINEMIGKEIYITQKQDGSSMTVIWKTTDDNKRSFELAKRNISIWKVVDGVTEYE